MSRQSSLLGPVVLTAAVVVAAVVGITLLSSLYTVDEREVAVVVEFGEPIVSRTEPGLYWKTPFIQEVRRLPSTLQFYRTGPGDKLEDLPTADGLKIDVSAFAVWKITDPLGFVQNLRTVEAAEERIVRARVKSEIRDVVTSVALAEVVRSSNRELTYNFGVQTPAEPGASGAVVPGEEGGAALGDVMDISLGREKIIATIRQRLRENLAREEGDDLGVEIVDVGISNIEFVPAVRQASFARFRTELESYAIAFRTAGERRKQEILNKTNAEVERIEGDGERQSKEIRGQVDARNIREFAAAITETGDFYSFQKKLDLYREALKGDTRLILTTDSELLGMLKELEPADAAPDTGSAVADAPAEE
ncbi:protease modulator HflC [Alienimonas californiensis]|uniref:Protein HflC n=1 Tax=Alienimonas californiensis TaxID=2527989 RepID=A0A517PD79_9PLAN|nr:protease modulator HflC [Alienimonas californiensis]QDT17332.1 Modulator of FtsH protease HflC [Alienimonas californiensis]